MRKTHWLLPLSSARMRCQAQMAAENHQQHKSQTHARSIDENCQRPGPGPASGRTHDNHCAHISDFGRLEHAIFPRLIRIWLWSCRAIAFSQLAVNNAHTPLTIQWPKCISSADTKQKVVSIRRCITVEMMMDARARPCGGRRMNLSTKQKHNKCDINCGFVQDQESTKPHSKRSFIIWS